MIRTIRNDSDMVRVARQLDRHLLRVYELCSDLADSDYEPARDFADELGQNEIPVMAHATSIVVHCLEHPERWRHTFRDIVRVKKNPFGEL